MAKISLDQRKAIKEVINKNFTFSDLSKRFVNVDSSTGNIFCPFHENTDTPAAKMYWDDERNIWIIHCFGKCHRNFTTYDYVDLVLCKKYGRYSSPYHFLTENMSQEQLSAELTFYVEASAQETRNSFEKKISYINSVFQKHENAIDYIEELYTR